MNKYFADSSDLVSLVLTIGCTGTGAGIQPSRLEFSVADGLRQRMRAAT